MNTLEKYSEQYDNFKKSQNRLEQERERRLKIHRLEFHSHFGIGIKDKSYRIFRISRWGNIGKIYSMKFITLEEARIRLQNMETQFIKEYYL